MLLRIVELEQTSRTGCKAIPILEPVETSSGQHDRWQIGDTLLAPALGYILRSCRGHLTQTSMYQLEKQTRPGGVHMLNKANGNPRKNDAA